METDMLELQRWNLRFRHLNHLNKNLHSQEKYKKLHYYLEYITCKCGELRGGGNQHADVTIGRGGGFSEGIITLDTETTLYVAVGGQGLTNVNGGAGGFNGGGATTNRTNGAGSGGGATHISGASGLLNNNNVRDNIHIVAGGGGGRGGSSQVATGGDGGAGGGLIGVQGMHFTASVTRSGGTRRYSNSRWRSWSTYNANANPG